VFGVSRLFFKKYFPTNSLDFRRFFVMRKVHQQAISTGGNFIRELVKKTRATSRRKSRARFCFRWLVESEVVPVGR